MRGLPPPGELAPSRLLMSFPGRTAKSMMAFRFSERVRPLERKSRARYPKNNRLRMAQKSVTPVSHALRFSHILLTELRILRGIRLLRRFDSVRICSAARPRDSYSFLLVGPFIYRYFDTAIGAVV